MNKSLLLIQGDLTHLELEQWEMEHCNESKLERYYDLENRKTNNFTNYNLNLSHAT